MKRLDYMKDDGIFELFDLEGLEEVLDAAEKKDLEALKKAQRVTKAEYEEFRGQLRAYREASAPKRGQPAAKKSKTAAFRGKAYPKFLPSFSPVLRVGEDVAQLVRAQMPCLDTGGLNRVGTSAAEFRAHKCYSELFPSPPAEFRDGYVCRARPGILGEPIE